jgi:hypothetical protein
MDIITNVLCGLVDLARHDMLVASHRQRHPYPCIPAVSDDFDSYVVDQKCGKRNRAVCLIQANTILEMRGLSLCKRHPFQVRHGTVLPAPLTSIRTLCNGTKLAMRQSADSED